MSSSRVKRFPTFSGQEGMIRSDEGWATIDRVEKFITEFRSNKRENSIVCRYSFKNITDDDILYSFTSTISESNQCVCYETSTRIKYLCTIERIYDTTYAVSFVSFIADKITWYSRSSLIISCERICWHPCYSSIITCLCIIGYCIPYGVVWLIITVIYSC